MRFYSQKPLVLISMLCLVLLASCDSKPQSPEDEITRFIEAGIEAAENRARGDLVDMVADDYSDRRNNNRKKLDRMLLALFFRHKNIYLFKRISDIRITGKNSATVELFVAMTGQRLSDITKIASFRAQIYRFEMELIKDDEWKVLSADWQRARATDLQ